MMCRERKCNAGRRIRGLLPRNVSSRRSSAGNVRSVPSVVCVWWIMRAVCAGRAGSYQGEGGRGERKVPGRAEVSLSLALSVCVEVSVCVQAQRERETCSRDQHKGRGTGMSTPSVSPCVYLCHCSNSA